MKADQEPTRLLQDYSLLMLEEVLFSDLAFVKCFHVAFLVHLLWVQRSEPCCTTWVSVSSNRSRYYLMTEDLFNIGERPARPMFG
jgi:hypothetical protein